MCISCAEILERATKKKGTETVLNDLLRSMDSTMGNAWEVKSNAAIKKAVNKMGGAKTTKAGLAALLASLSSELKTIMTPKQEKRFHALVDSFYKTAKKATVKPLKTKFVMGTVDKEVVETLANDGPFWINEFYGEHLSARITEVGRQATVEAGLGRKEAGKEMRRVLTEEFRRSGGPSSFKSTIPARYAGRVDEYTRIVSSNVAQRARVYSNIVAFNNAGIQRYVFSAVMDDRTSEICQEMNERVFTVSQGMKHVNAVAASEDPEEFKAAHPWPANADAVRKIAGKGTMVQQSERLSDAGIPNPPLHGFCRSTVLALA